MSYLFTPSVESAVAEVSQSLNRYSDITVEAVAKPLAQHLGVKQEIYLIKTIGHIWKSDAFFSEALKNIREHLITTITKEKLLLLHT
jgi:uncharacterized protein YdiU (UPF0061 family)